jgi:hypothetical protein
MPIMTMDNGVGRALRPSEILDQGIKPQQWGFETDPTLDEELIGQALLVQVFEYVPAAWRQELAHWALLRYGGPFISGQEAVGGDLQQVAGSVEQQF